MSNAHILERPRTRERHQEQTFPDSSARQQQGCPFSSAPRARQSFQTPGMAEGLESGGGEPPDRVAAEGNIGTPINVGEENARSGCTNTSSQLSDSHGRTGRMLDAGHPEINGFTEDRNHTYRNKSAYR